MNVSYCDLCDCVIKPGESFMLYINKSNTNTEPMELKEYLNHLQKLSKEVKEICPSCKYVFDKIFELKFRKGLELTQKVLDIYDVPSKKNLEGENNDKKFCM